MQQQFQKNLDQSICLSHPLFLSTRRPVCNASEVMQIISSVLKLRAHCPTFIHTDSSRSHLIVTLTISSKSPNALALGELQGILTAVCDSCDSCFLTIITFHSARRLQSAKMDLQQHSTQKEWWSPRCRRANSAARHSSDEVFASTSSSPCPSPRHIISQTPFRTKLHLVDLAGSECVGRGSVGFKHRDDVRQENELILAC